MLKSKRIPFLLGVSIALCLCLLGFFSAHLCLDAASSRQGALHSYQVLSTMERTQTSFNQSIESSRSYLLTGNILFKKRFSKFKVITLDESRILQGLVRDNPSQTRRVKELQKHLNLRFAVGENFFKLYDRGEGAKATKIVASPQFQAIRARTLVFFEDLLREEGRLLQKRLHREASLVTEIVGTLMLVCSVLVISVFKLLKFYLREQKENESARIRLSNFFDFSKDLYCFADDSGYFTRVNSSWTRVLGYTTEELLSEPLLNKVHPDDVTNTLLEMKQMHRLGYTEEFINRYRAKDGTYRTLLWKSVYSSSERVTYAVAHDITEQLENEQKLKNTAKQLKERNDQVDADMMMARDIHELLRSPKFDTMSFASNREEWKINLGNRYQMSEELGGDLACYLPLSESKCGVLIFDVMGHGIRSALLSIVLKLLSETHAPHCEGPVELLEQLNKNFCLLLEDAPTVIFATALCLVVDLETREMKVASAGHLDPMLVNQVTKEVTLLACENGPAIGIFPEAKFPETTFVFQPDESLLLFTDGLFEVENEEGHSLSEERFLAIIQENAHQPLEKLFDGVLAKIREISTHNTFSDDVCLVGIQLTVEKL